MKAYSQRLGLIRRIGAHDETDYYGLCRFCGAETWLYAYDTREYITLFGAIPIIPLRRHRIHQQCALCGEHLRLPACGHQEILATELSFWEDKPQHRTEYLRQAIRLGVCDKAYLEAHYPQTDHPELATVYYLGGYNKIALELWERAPPATTLAQVQLCDALYRTGQAPLIGPKIASWEGHNDDPGLLRFAALAAQECGQAKAALALWEQIEPAYLCAKDHLTMRTLQANLGLKLSLLDRLGLSNSPLGAMLGSIAALTFGLALLGGGLLSWWQARHTQLWVVNATPANQELVIAAQRQIIYAGKTIRLTLPEGRYQAQYRPYSVEDKSPPAAIQTELNLVASGPWARLWGQDVFILNLHKAGVFGLEEAAYSRDNTRPPKPEQLISAQEFLVFQELDHLFEPLPASLSATFPWSHKLRRGLKLHSTSPLELGQNLLASGQYAQAQVHFDIAIGYLPDAAAALLGQATVAYQSGNLPAAKAQVDSILSQQPWYIDAHILNQDIMMALDHAATMTTYYQQLEREHPESATARYLAGRLHFPASKRLQSFLGALALRKNFYYGYLGAAATYLDLGQFHKALAMAKLATAARPKDPEASMLTFAATIVTANYPQAIIQGQALYSSFPDYPGLARLLLFALEETATKPNLQSRIIAGNPQLMAASRYRKGLKMLQPEHNDRSRAAHWQRFIGAYRQKQWNQATRALDGLLKNFTGGAEQEAWYFYLIDCLVAQGKPEAGREMAEEIYLQALQREHSPAHPLARIYMDQIGDQEFASELSCFDNDLQRHGYLLRARYLAREGATPGRIRTALQESLRRNLDHTFPYQLATTMLAELN